MNPRGLLALAGAILSSVALAHPDPSKTNDHGGLVNLNQPDPLWEKYGLNKSEEFKYFHEPGNDDILGHYDSRFFTGNPVPDAERSRTLTHMIRAYLNYFEDHGLETWIAHGTLLGWWWNGKIMPWDWDIDTQVPDTTLLYLADHYNQTIVDYVPPDTKEERKYLIDVNPWARQRDRGKGLNIIDARWIDMKTGLYIDITGLSNLDPEQPDTWQCKNNHKYEMTDIYPLRKTTFENVVARVPFHYDSVLVEEYNKKALISTHYHNHSWRPDLGEWVADEPAPGKEENDDRQYE